MLFPSNHYYHITRRIIYQLELFVSFLQGMLLIIYMNFTYGALCNTIKITTTRIKAISRVKSKYINKSLGGIL